MGTSSRLAAGRLVCLASVILVASCLGCDDGGADGARNGDEDASVDLGVEADVGPATDLGAPPDAGVADAADAGPAICQRDRDCVDLESPAYCEANVCVVAPAAPLVPPIMDGVTRAAAGALDITPEYLERWQDNAGADCPQNRPRRYDGRLDTESEDCADGFEDANGDGAFNAVWLAGDATSRPATGVANDNPPAGRVLLLVRDDVLRVLVTYDLYAIDAARIEGLQRRLGLRLGLAPNLISVHATGVRHGPDAVGLWGPGATIGGGPEAFFARAGADLGVLGTVPYASGVDERWWEQVATRTAAAVRAASSSLVPVVSRHAVARLPLGGGASPAGPIQVPDIDEDGQRNDADDLAAHHARPTPFATDGDLPNVRDPRLYAVALEAESDGSPVAHLLGWGVTDAHVDAADGQLSAGFPGLVRARLEAAVPGTTAIWLTSGGSDTVVVDARTFVPRVSEAGQLLGPDGDVVDAVEDAAPAESPVAAIARYLAVHALDALAEAPESPTAFTARSRFAWVPIRNPRFGVAARVGVLGPLGSWLSGRSITTAWSSGATTPACGGLGCARYRLERISLGDLVLVTVPGALDDGYVQGQEDATLAFDDRRDLRDLDGDNIADSEDPEVQAMTRSGGRETTVVVPGPLNPQRFAAIEGLASESVWVVGRTNGGVGTLRSSWSTPNVFEGAAESFARFAEGAESAAIDLCGAGYPCVGGLTVGELSRRTLEAQPTVLADLRGAHEARISGANFDAVERVSDAWRIEDEYGEVRVTGGPLELGPDDRIYAAGHNLDTAEVTAGDSLIVAGEPERVWRILNVVPLELSTHPNAADAWTSGTPDGGDLVYNVACELIFDGVCPHRREVFGADPNQSLPRAP